MIDQAKIILGSEENLPKSGPLVALLRSLEKDTHPYKFKAEDAVDIGSLMGLYEDRHFDDSTPEVDKKILIEKAKRALEMAMEHFFGSDIERSGGRRGR